MVDGDFKGCLQQKLNLAVYFRKVSKNASRHTPMLEFNHQVLVARHILSVV